MRTMAAIAALSLALSTTTVLAQQPAAKALFGNVATPAPLASRSIGFYSRGCLAGAHQLPGDGPEWQVMRPSRNRNWGTPELVAFVEKLAHDARALDGLPGLLVGDLSQPRGGPMTTGHASHQVGLDVDIWFDPMPNRMLSYEERETIAATSYIVAGTNVELDRNRWTEAQNRLIRRAASYPEVERIFVNAGIKRELCQWAGGDRAWLRKVRPWYAHDDHLHVRLRCPPGMAGCTPQNPPPMGDDCGSNLAWWLSPEPYKPPEGPVSYAPELTLADLPSACTGILTAGRGGLTPADLNAPPPPLPRLRPQAG